MSNFITITLGSLFWFDQSSFHFIQYPWNTLTVRPNCSGSRAAGQPRIPRIHYAVPAVPITPSNANGDFLRFAFKRAKRFSNRFAPFAFRPTQERRSDVRRATCPEERARKCFFFFPVFFRPSTTQLNSQDTPASRGQPLPTAAQQQQQHGSSRARQQEGERLSCASALRCSLQPTAKHQAATTATTRISRSCLSASLCLFFPGFVFGGENPGNMRKGRSRNSYAPRREGSGADVCDDLMILMISEILPYGVRTR